MVHFVAVPFLLFSEEHLFFSYLDKASFTANFGAISTNSNIIGMVKKIRVKKNGWRGGSA